MNKRDTVASRRRFLATVGFSSLTAFAGCRSHQYGHVLTEDQQDMTGSHTAGAATYKPLVDEAVAKLLGRCGPVAQPVAYGGPHSMPISVCFIGIENKSVEELGDFKDQIYELIDSQIVQAPTFNPINRRFVDAGLRQTRLRPDQLFIPQNMQMFTESLSQQGQPLDYLLYATLTSGTTENNKNNYQRDYLLTLEMIDVHTGNYDKQTASLRKGYHRTTVGKFRFYNPLKKVRR